MLWLLIFPIYFSSIIKFRVFVCSVQCVPSICKLCHFLLKKLAWFSAAQYSFEHFQKIALIFVFNLFASQVMAFVWPFSLTVGRFVCVCVCVCLCVFVCIEVSESKHRRTDSERQTGRQTGGIVLRLSVCLSACRCCSKFVHSFSERS